MSSRPIQVNANSYRQNYMTLPRLITHWYQASEVAGITKPGGKVLEIGPGAGHTTWLMKHWGLNVTTLDFDGSVNPDIIGDVTNLPCETNSFDCIIAAEVLEHIPFSEFEKALVELKRVSQGHVILTLPAPFVGVAALLNCVGISLKGFLLGFPYWVNHKFDGQHYWELGKRGFSLWRIRRLLKSNGFEIVKAFRPAPSRYCYFFVLKVPA